MPRPDEFGLARLPARAVSLSAMRQLRRQVDRGPFHDNTLPYARATSYRPSRGHGNRGQHHRWLGHAGGLPERIRRVSRPHRDTRGVARSRRGIPVTGLGDHDRRELQGSADPDDQDQRPRGHGRERARGPHHGPDPCPGASHDGGGAGPRDLAHAGLRHVRTHPSHRGFDRDLHRARREPRRRRLRHRAWLLPPLAQESPAARGSHRHRPQPELLVPLGMLRRLERDAIGPVVSRSQAVLRHPRTVRCATSWSLATSP